MEIRSAFGEGIHDKGEYLGYCNKVATKEYVLWHGMLERCYSLKYHTRYPTYKNCKTSENFKSFQYFAEWCNNQIGFGLNGYQLDKDILGNGKLYSEYTCCFVPKELNYLFTSRANHRGKYPLGVYFHKASNKFLAQLNKGAGKSEYLGIFTTPQEAHEAYKIAKELFVREQAERYKQVIDIEVYNALSAWKVPEQEAQGELKVVFKDGVLYNETSLSEIRNRLWNN